MRILVTGAAGFLAGYLVPELLEAGHEVIGVEHFGTYGPTSKSYDAHPRYRLVTGDAMDTDLLRALAADCDQIVANAGLTGRGSSFSELAYDLLATNERIMAATFDAAIDAFLDAHLGRIVVISSSMVYEAATMFPTPEGAERVSAPPVSTFGFQKLASEYFARGAWEQYRLPYTILRLSNVVGIGEKHALHDRDALSGNVRQAMSNTVSELCLRVLHGEDPVHILGEGNQVRQFTYAGDAARGIRMAMESDAARNADFNIARGEGTTILELAERIWRKVNGDRPFRYVSDAPYRYDVPFRVPDVRKAKAVLGFEATTTLDEMLDEVIPWIRAEFASGPGVAPR